MACVVAALAIGACGDDRNHVDDGAATVRAAPDVVAVAATPCSRPLARDGVATIVGPDLALTANHVVEGPLRRLEVGGESGVVLRTDPRLDLALVVVEGLSPAAAIPEVREPDELAETAETTLVTPDGAEPVVIDRTVRLTVTDHTDGTEYERRSHVLEGAVPPGTSGAPVVADDAIVGVVTLAIRGPDESHAVAGDEIARFLDTVGGVPPDGVSGGSAVTC